MSDADRVVGLNRSEVASIEAATALERARGGDHHAFRWLVERHDPAMRRLAYRLLGDPADMDDALQDAYLKAFRKLDTFDGRSALSSWLYSVTYHSCIDVIRARGRRSVEVRLDPSHGAIAGSDNFPERLADRSLLRQALLELPVDQAAAVLLVDGEGLSYGEAADALGVEHGTIGSRLSRARHRLRDQLGESQDGGQQ